MKKVLGIIPARMESTRFPGKPLVNISGKTMIQRVFERASSCKTLDHLLIATDSSQIKQYARDFGAPVCMTSYQHKTGLGRILEVKKKTWV